MDEGAGASVKRVEVSYDEAFRRRAALLFMMLVNGVMLLTDAVDACRDSPSSAAGRGLCPNRMGQAAKRYVSDS